MPTQTEVVNVSVHTGREREDQLRPLHEFQADLEQFFDVPSRKRILVAELPYGTAYIKQGEGQQGQSFDVVTVNEHGAFAGRFEKNRRELRRFIDRDGHELRVRRGQIGEDWPSRVAEVRP